MKCVLLCLALVVSTPGVPAAQAPGESILPDTLLGRRLRAYVDSFNTGDENAVRDFILTNIAKSSLAERPVEARLARYREIYANLRGLQIKRVLGSDATSITALVRTASGETVSVRVEVEPDPPNGITGIAIEQRQDGEEDEAPASTTVPAPDSDRTRVARRADEYLSRLTSFGF